MLKKDSLNLKIKLFFLVLFKYINKICVLENNIIVVYINNKDLSSFLDIVKNSMLFNFRGLVDITAIDRFFFSDRFELSYNLLDYKGNFRFLLNTYVYVDNKMPYGPGINSASSLFKSAVWLEREIWDMFGIFFLNHPDLRRILTDYGFSGFPFRKDFPLTGYKEIRYDESQKIIVTESLKLNQEFRSFNFVNPWIK